jgi:hypothetical protein
MKNKKQGVLFVVGILAALLAAGCSSPVVPSPGETAQAGGETYDLDSPFVVTFTIGEDGTSRSIAGQNSNWITVTGANGPRNIVQLLVLEQGATEIVGIDEDRKALDSPDSTFNLKVESLVRGKQYAFLLLMGHWPNDGSSYANSSPTLLSAGLTKDQSLQGTGTTQVSITMYPLLVDTQFERVSDSLIVEPKVIGGKPYPAYITPGNWQVNWKVQRTSGLDGFKDLIAAQKLANAQSSGTDLLIKGKQNILNTTRSGNGLSTKNTFDFSLGTLANQASGSVNFNLEYVPFNLPSPKWNGKTSGFFNMTNGPVWIIRNGLNDTAQDGNTEFSNGLFSNKNGNGGVRFQVGLPPKGSDPGETPDSITLEVDDGAFKDTPYKPAPTITFETDGYEDSAEVWYAIVPADGPAPDREDYVWLDTIGGPSDYEEAISVDSDFYANSKEYDVYVIISKGGEVSPPEKISSKGNRDVVIAFKDAIELVYLTTRITKPVAGKAPTTTSFSDTQYISGNVSWKTSLGANVQGNFAGGTVYVATVTLDAKDGDIFIQDGDNDTVFMYEDATTVQGTVFENGDKATVTITFPQL